MASLARAAYDNRVNELIRLRSKHYWQGEIRQANAYEMQIEILYEGFNPKQYPPDTISVNDVVYELDSFRCVDRNMIYKYVRINNAEGNQTTEQ